jgi:hypothetical protein
LGDYSPEAKQSETRHVTIRGFSTGVLIAVAGWVDPGTLSLEFRLPSQYLEPESFRHGHRASAASVTCDVAVVTNLGRVSITIC